MNEQDLEPRHCVVCGATLAMIGGDWWHQYADGHIAGTCAPPTTGSAEPVAPPSVSENQATRALALALADGFRAKGLNTVDVAAALIREHDELVEENARLTAGALARAPQGDPPAPDEVSMLRAAIRAALNEIGIPGDGYPAPVANAHTILTDAIARPTSAPETVRVPAPQGDAAPPLWNNSASIGGLYHALGQIKGINSDCERHRNAPWQLQCETCRRFVATELAFQGVRGGASSSGSAPAEQRP